MRQIGQIKFISKDKNLFFPTLKKSIDEYFSKNNISRNANATMIIKTVIMLAAYILPFLTLLFFTPPFWASMMLWILMGMGISGIGMSVMHDANHGAYSSNEKINYIMGHALNLVGGSVFNWKLQHNILHHTYTNIVYMDDDINDKLVLKFSPHTPVKLFHKFQWMYAFLFYSIMTVYWIFLKDFVQFIKYTLNGVNKNTTAQNIAAMSKIVIIKVFYFFLIWYVPAHFFNIAFSQILVGFFLMHFTSGIILTLAFQLAHSVEEAAHPLPTADGVIENDWAIHQMNTTVNFCRKNKLISWYVGGLNYQVEHHLFPRICHVHYPQISGIVQKTAKEFGIPYLEKETFAEALRSHIANLRQLGRLPHPNEAIV